VTSGRTVLALEFRGVGDTADFGFLSREASSAVLSRVDPLVQHLGGPLTLPEQARLLIDALPEPPGLVLSYCGTAGLGLHVAALTDAESVLVDPYPVTSDDMRRDFANLCASLGIAPTGLVAPGADPDVARWEKALWQARDGMAEVHGGDEDAYELVDDLLDRYRAWLRFLQASRVAGPVTARGSVSVVTAKSEVPLQDLLVFADSVEVHRVEAGTGILNSAEARALLSTAVLRHSGK
jgi:hypothetical protein